MGYSNEAWKNRKKIKSLKSVDVCLTCFYLSPYTHWCFRDDIQAFVFDNESCDYYVNKQEEEKRIQEKFEKERKELKDKYNEMVLKKLEKKKED